MTAEKPEAKKLREFWIDPTPDNAEELANELDTAIYIAMDKHPRQGPLQWQSNLINVREVSPELDKAIEGLVELVKKAVSKNHSWPTNELQDYQEWIAKWINDSRAALKEIERMNG